MTRNEVVRQAIAGELRWVDAGTILGLSTRQLLRLKRRFDPKDPSALGDKRVGKAPSRKVAPSTSQLVLKLYAEEYAGFNLRHFHEELGERGIKVGYTWMRELLCGASLYSRVHKAKAYRRKRERRPMRGLLVHLDGSKHAWFADKKSGGMQDLLVALDDATGEILSARFVPEESTVTCLEIVREVVQKHGVFASLYTDRASHFVVTRDAAAGPDRTRKTQLESILDELGTELICAYSPQARGRSERMFRTLQGRLPAELRRAGIGSYDEANAYLVRFLPRFNKRFAIEPAIKDDHAYVTAKGIDLDRIFALRFKRTVGKDNVVRFQRHHLQLPKPAGVATNAGRIVDVRLSLSGRLSIYTGSRLLYTAELHVDWEEGGLDEAA